MLVDEVNSNVLSQQLKLLSTFQLTATSVSRSKKKEERNGLTE